MADDKKLVIEAVLDTSQTQAAFEDISKSGNKAASSLQSGFSKANPLTGLNSELSNASRGFDLLGVSLSRALLPLAALSTAILAVKKAIELISESERNEQLVNSFNAAAASAGVLGDNLSRALERAAASTADLEDVLKVATQGANELGKGVERYPELLELARKASIQFGGSVIENFERLNNAIVSGSTRSIRDIAVIDVTKAQKEYAEALGTTIDQLTEQEKRQATLNAVLEKGSKNLQAVKTDQENLATTIARGKVVIGETFEALGDRLRETLGVSLQDVAKYFVDIIAKLRDFIKPAPEIERVRSRIDAINSELQNVDSTFNKVAGSVANFFGFKTKDKRTELQAELESLQSRLKELEQSEKLKIEIKTEIKPPKDPEIERIALDNQAKFNAKLSELNKAAQDAQFQARLAQAKSNEQRYRIELERLAIDSANRLQDIDKELGNLRFISDVKLNEARLAEVARFNAEVIKLEAKREQDKNSELKKLVNPTIDTEAERIALENQAAFNAKLAELNREAREAEFQARLAQAQTKQEAYQIELERLAIDSANRLQAIDNEFGNLRFVSDAQRNEARLAEVARFNAEVMKLEAKHTQDQIKEQQRRQQLILQINAATQQALVSVTSSAFQALGASLLNGGKAWSNFSATVLGILGDLLINIGQSIIAASSAIKALAIALANPFGFLGGLVAGGALIALGAALKALANSKSKAAASYGGGSVATYTPPPPPTPTFGGGVTDVGGQPVNLGNSNNYDFQERDRQVRQDVQVIIQGDVLDSDETGLRIVELINKAFDKQGVTVRRGYA